MAISGHSNEQSCVIQQKTVTGTLDGILKTLFLNLEASLYEHSKSVTLELSVNQRRADEYVQLKVCSIAVILVL